MQKKKVWNKVFEILGQLPDLYSKTDLVGAHWNRLGDSNDSPQGMFWNKNICKKNSSEYKIINPPSPTPKKNKTKKTPKNNNIGAHGLR